MLHCLWKITIDQSGFTTRHACWCRPIGVSKSCFLQDFLSLHWPIVPRHSGGRCSSIAITSINIPRKLMSMQGPHTYASPMTPPTSSTLPQSVLRNYCNCLTKGGWLSHLAQLQDILCVGIYSSFLPASATRSVQSDILLSLLTDWPLCEPCTWHG